MLAPSLYLPRLYLGVAGLTNQTCIHNKDNSTTYLLHAPRCQVYNTKKYIPLELVPPPSPSFEGLWLACVLSPSFPPSIGSSTASVLHECCTPKKLFSGGSYVSACAKEVLGWLRVSWMKAK